MGSAASTPGNFRKYCDLAVFRGQFPGEIRYTSGASASSFLAHNINVLNHGINVGFSSKKLNVS
jgi:hypothetical protein